MAFPRIEGYVVTEKIGSGSYSTVYKAYNKVGGRQTLAIKCVEKARVQASGAAVDNLVSEIRLLKTLAHPHIVHMHNFTWDDKNIYIITEYCNAGDLSRYIRRYGRVPEPQVRYFLQQLATALRYLHERGVAHMDLKPHNLLLHKDAAGRLTLKVADFGFAAMVTSVCAGGVRGSPLYMAPEVVAGHPSAAGDLWSVGVIMYECLFGRAPYASATVEELLRKIQRREPVRLPADAGVSAGCRELLLALLRHEPAERLSHEAFFAHEYLDLAHMPTADHYREGVRLVCAAVEAEGAGDARAALRLYAEGLRYLLPAAAVEPEPARRAALNRKLARYMERAEEIKLALSGGAPPAPPAPPAPGNEEPPPAHHQVAPSQAAEAAEAGGARGALRRLFSRRGELPPLAGADCSLVSAGRAHSSAGGAAAAADDDRCRIS